MEVHHHSHTSDPDPSTSSGHRGRKKFTHYLWEFLMLFLAVFCGFLAENIREHKIEREREKQFIKSLAGDIKADKEIIDNLIPGWSTKSLQSDSLMNLLAGKEISSD